MIVKKVDVSVLPQIQTKVKLIKMNGVKPLLVVPIVLMPHSRLRACLCSAFSVCLGITGS